MNFILHHHLESANYSTNYFHTPQLTIGKDSKSYTIARIYNCRGQFFKNIL